MAETARPLELLVSRQELHDVVARLARQIDRDYAGRRPILVAIFKGSFIFVADLVRQLQLPVRVDFVKVGAYGMATSPSQVRMHCPLAMDISGEDVLALDDLVDTGVTTAYILRYLREKNPASLKLCTLLDKPSRRIESVDIDYSGLTIPDRFIVGYGMDLGEEYRNLPEVYALPAEEDGSGDGALGTL